MLKTHYKAECSSEPTLTIFLFKTMRFTNNLFYSNCLNLFLILNTHTLVISMTSTQFLMVTKQGQMWESVLLGPFCLKLKCKNSFIYVV